MQQATGAGPPDGVGGWLPGTATRRKAPVCTHGVGPGGGRVEGPAGRYLREHETTRRMWARTGRTREPPANIDANVRDSTDES